MGLVTIGIGQYLVSKHPENTLITYALGPCLGITCFDPETSLTGLIHCQLPLSKDDPSSSANQPARYVDTGVTLLLTEMQAMGATLERMSICVAGGAQISEGDSVFNIGQRNHNVFRKLMWKNALIVDAEDIGGTRPRTLSIEVGTGDVFVTTDRARELLHSCKE